MVWAAIGIDFGASPLIIMPRNARNTVASEEYTEALEQGFLQFAGEPLDQ
jgi:hypothetical protein